MILEVIDQGRLEKLAVVNGSAGKDIDGVVFDGLGFEWMKVSNPFVDIQTRSS